MPRKRAATDTVDADRPEDQYQDDAVQETEEEATEALPSNPQEAAVVEAERAEEKHPTSDMTEHPEPEPNPDTVRLVDQEQEGADKAAEGRSETLPRTAGDPLADQTPTVAVDMPAEVGGAPEQSYLAQTAPHRQGMDNPDPRVERDPTQPPSAFLDADPGKRAAGSEVDAADGPTSSDDRQAGLQEETGQVHGGSGPQEATSLAPAPGSRAARTSAQDRAQGLVQGLVAATLDEGQDFSHVSSTLKEMGNRARFEWNAQQEKAKADRQAQARS